MGWFPSSAERERRRAERESRQAERALLNAASNCAAAIRRYGETNRYEVTRITGQPVISAYHRLLAGGRRGSEYSTMLTSEVLALHEIRDGRP